VVHENEGAEIQRSVRRRCGLSLYQLCSDLFTFTIVGRTGNLTRCLHFTASRTTGCTTGCTTGVQRAVKCIRTSKLTI